MNTFPTFFDSDEHPDPVNTQTRALCAGVARTHARTFMDYGAELESEDEEAEVK